MSNRGDRGRGGGDRGGRGARGGRGYDRGRGGGGPPQGRGGYEGGGGRGFGGDRGGGRGFDRGGGRGFDRGGGRGYGDRGGGGGGGGGGYGAPREQGGVFAPNVPATVDARITDASEDALVAAFKKVTLNTGDLPPRPGFGTKGQEMKLRTNFFPVRVSKAPLYVYDVVITPTAGTAPRRMKRRIFTLAEDTPDWAQKGLKGKVAHDHASKLVAAIQLPQPLTIAVPFYDEDEDGPPATGGKTYTLTFSYVQELDTGNLVSYLSRDPQHRNHDILPVVSALNLILSAHAGRSGGAGVEVGRNKFFFPSVTAQRAKLGGGLEAWKGFYSSVRPAYKQLMVNVNVCTTAFYVPQNLAVALMEFMNSTFGARADAFARGCRVKTLHLGYKKTVKRVSRYSATQHRFQCDELGGNVTVAEYFLRKYKKVLQYPNLPLVDVGGQKQNLLPAEMCMILPDQPFRGKLTDEHTAEMIKVACKPANINAEFITGPGLKELGFKDTAAPMGEFGVSVGQEMSVVPGRLLPKPTIRYATSSANADERASWNLRAVKFSRGAKLEKWAVLVLQDGGRDDFTGETDPALQAVITGFSSMCRTSGMTVDQTPPTKIVVGLPRKDQQDPTRKAATKAIQAAMMGLKDRKIAKPKLMMVMLSSGDKHVYAGLKSLCDVELGISTVCVHSAKIRKEKGQVQYFANVALKVNMKLGGINHVLDNNNMTWLNKEPTMIVGMDVTHPGPGSVKGTPSIAAVVASVDNKFAQFPASLGIQTSKKEMIERLKEMMIERLEDFKAQNTGKLPARILVYRDGVSEGQFDIVLREEVPPMREAFKTYGNAKAPYKPKLTVVICGKRHHTRFFPTEQANADQNGNPKAGTVVDRGITAVYDFDFFLQAHGGLQGTTRPTHYYVIGDENGFTADQMQTLTHEVSYMFARATKAVSLVSPAYYADIACERGRCYLHSLMQGFSDTSGTSASGGTRNTDEEKVFQEATNLWHGGVHKDLKKTMFYL